MKTTTETRFTRAEIRAEAARRRCAYWSTKTIHADGSYSGVRFAKKPKAGFKPLSMLAE